jgi:trehalose-phosphatase
MLPDDLTDALLELSRTPVLLVASDYDGVIAPIVTDPDEARPKRETAVALRGLAELPDTHVAVISGRALRDLTALSRFPAEIHLVGSHGSEFDVGFATAIDEHTRERIALVQHEMALAGDVVPGARVERKPTGGAFHYRTADPAAARTALTKLRERLAKIPGVSLMDGHMVLDASAIELDKGAALTRLRRSMGATAVLVLGDDRTDEKAFAVTSAGDVTAKVGPGETLARFRVDGPDDAAQLLAMLLELRLRWLFGADAVPIEQHTLLSDQRSHAVVDPSGRVVWFCHPRLDASAVFAELVGGSSAGHFSVGPIPGRAPLSQRYVDGSLVLRTRWPGLTVLDYVDHDARSGTTSLVRVLAGKGPARIEFSPRIDFGRAPTRLVVENDALRVAGPADVLVLHAPGVVWEITEDGPHQTATAIVEPGEGLVLDLRSNAVPRDEPEPDRREQVLSAWKSWVDALHVPRTGTDLVVRSALILKGLCHPSGSVVAAATTSLPEELGGSRNWDYRYCWLRDAALTVASLARLGSTAEAQAFLEWTAALLDRAQEGGFLRPVYTVDGHDLPPEAVIPQLAGYAGSRPVRVGNAAEHQLQLDVLGPLAELAYQLTTAGVPGMQKHLPLVNWCAEAVGRRWNEADHGIWEVRLAPRHYVHSKVMCWVTLDRAVKVHALLGAPAQDWWVFARDAIGADVLENGWNDAIGAFTSWYGGTALDAAALHVGLSGLISPADPRFASTVEAIEADLRAGHTLYRYRFDDGLTGNEGGFLLCAAWLLQSYLLLERPDDAIALFDQIADTFGPTGTASEMWDPVAKRALGNIPQAYSHLGIIDSAVALDAGGFGDRVFG